MVMLTDCPACQRGQHDGHVKDWSPAPKGMMGGYACACEGECVEREQSRPAAAYLEGLDHELPDGWPGVAAKTEEHRGA